MRALCSHLNNKQMADRIKSACKPKDGRSFLSHTDRYVRCSETVPKIPEWLVFPNTLRIAPLSGGPGDETFEKVKFFFSDW